MVGPRLRGQVKIGAEKRRAKFGDEFLHGVAFIPEPLAPEFTGQP